MTYYSAKTTRQDQWVIECVFDGLRGGYFVDVGAARGLVASNTYALETEYGWTGICIEANPEQFEELRKVRSCICENVCVYSERRVVRFTQPGQHRGYGGISHHLTERKKKFWSHDAVEAQMETVTLEDVLSKHGAPETIQYLSLDIEGGEYEVLKNFPFDAYRFEAITVEGRSCDALLEANGYRRVESPFCSVIWEHFFLPADRVG